MLGVMLEPTPDPGQAAAAMPWQPARVPGDREVLARAIN